MYLMVSNRGLRNESIKGSHHPGGIDIDLGERCCVLGDYVMANRVMLSPREMEAVTINTKENVCVVMEEMREIVRQRLAQFEENNPLDAYGHMRLNLIKLELAEYHDKMLASFDVAISQLSAMAERDEDDHTIQ